MRITKKDIDVGNYIALGNKPWFISAYYRGEDKRTTHDMRKAELKRYEEELLRPSKKRRKAHLIKKDIQSKKRIYYWKVVSVKRLQVLYKPWGTKDTFKLKWITDVCKNYKEVMHKGGCR